MSTAAYRRSPGRPDLEAAEIEALVARIRREHESRSPQEARRVTLEALRRWKARKRSLRVFDPGRGA